MKRVLTLVALSALIVPAATAAPPPGKGKDPGSAEASPSPETTVPKPSQICSEQLETMGADSFRSLYAPSGNGRKAFGKCISQQAQLRSASITNAAKLCKAERHERGVAAFAERYGTNANKRNALGMCVSSKATESVEARQDATLDAVKLCKTERKELGVAAFREKYGASADKHSAFADCVLENAKPAPPT